MIERNESRYHLEQDNKTYILITSLKGDRLRLVCKDSNNSTFEQEFTMNDLTKISKYFQPTHTVEQIQGYLNGIIEKQRIGIVQNGTSLSIVLYLINNDKISIPILKKEPINNSFSYNNYNILQNFPITNNYMQMQQTSSSQNQFYNKNSNINIYQNNLNMGNLQLPQYQFQNNINNQEYLNLYLNRSQPQQLTGINKGIDNKSGIIQKNSQSNLNQLASFQNGLPAPQVESSSHLNYSYQYDESKIVQLEDDTNIIKAGQEKLKNDMQRLIEEASKLREQNQKYQDELDNIMQENTILKNENENYKNQITNFQNENKGLEELQEENESLRNQIDSLNKDIEAVDNQNNEIRKMYEELDNENNNYKNQNEELQNENNNYKNQNEELRKENDMLRAQIEELNNNFTLINNELENIKNENTLFKKDIEEQHKNNMNEELINKMIEENNMLKAKAEENDALKKQIEELQMQIQNGQEKQEEEDQDKEVKGEIIHDIKELEMITKKINKNEDKRIIINLLYKASVDGDKAAEFHEKCDQAQNTIVLVETKNGKRFGGFTTCSWSGNCVDKNDPEAFIFSFDKMKTYDNIPGDEAIGCYPKFGPIFLGCQIKIFDNAFTKGGTTYEKELNFNTEEDYELTGGDRVFEVKDIEVYEVILE